MDPTMSEVPPPRTKAPVARVSGTAATHQPQSQRPVEDLMARLTFPEDSDLESETRPVSRPDQTETTNADTRVEYAKIMARLDGLESLLEKHISGEATAKATICENLATNASTVAANSALLEKTIEVMKSIQADVNRITWHQFESVVKPSGRETASPLVCEERQSQSQESKSQSQESKSQLGGGCGWVATKEPISTQIPGYNSTRIEPNEFQAIKDDGNLKHVWLYIDACNEKAHKARVQSVTANDVNIIYSNGGCVFPYAKSCTDWEKFTDFRIKYLVAQHYSHCRPKS